MNAVMNRYFNRCAALLLPAILILMLGLSAGVNASGVGASISQQMATNTPRPSRTPPPTSTPQFRPLDIVVVITGAQVRVRQEPDTSSDIITTVNQGSRIPVISQAWVDSRPWYQVHLNDGREGWVFSGLSTLVVIWNPVIRTFDDTEMVLVPAGCYLMGSERGEADEQPVHAQCFDEPFWIDRYEVSNRRYGSHGYFTADTLPRETVNWYDAAAYCEARGARLPTEAEWEYAARSPYNFVYPWGNEFVDENSVSSWRTTSRQTESVGNRPEGVSWVGAYHMSGNVWEWTSTLYAEYPYDAADGREDADDDMGYRVVRGGGCCSYVIADVRAAVRFPIDPFIEDPNIGFRCARALDDE